MIAKLTSKNQLTLPKAAEKYFPNASHFDVEVREGALVLRPASIQVTGNIGEEVRKKIKKLGLKESVVAEAVRWARSRK